MTNYERIKAMSVEELSKFIKDVMLNRHGVLTSSY